MAAIVTGGVGFVGSHLLENLVQRNVDVAIFDLSVEGGEIPSSSRILRVVQGDVTNYDECQSFFKEVSKAHDITTIFHLAALASHRLSVQDPRAFLEANFRGTVNILEFARQMEPSPKVVFVSSSSVYGSCDTPIVEDTPPKPTSPYALSKYIGEQMCQLYSALYDLPVTVVRYFNVLGERCRQNVVMSIFAERLSRGLPPEVHGKWINGGFQPASRDFTYAGDIADGTALAGFARGSADGEVFNLGRGRGRSVMELANLMITEFGFRDKVRPLCVELEPHEAFTCSSDSSKARRVLGWKPTVDVEDIVHSYVKWFRRRELISARN